MQEIILKSSSKIEEIELPFLYPQIPFSHLSTGYPNLRIKLFPGSSNTVLGYLKSVDIHTEKCTFYSAQESFQHILKCLQQNNQF